MTTVTFILAILTGIILYLLWGWLRWIRYGRDPRQHELAGQLAEAGAKEIAFGEGLDTSSGVALYAMGQPWSEKEQARRLLHAASLLVDAPQDVQHRAEDIAKRAIKKLE